MKTLMYLGMSLNGYIARTDDTTPWPKEEWEAYRKISKEYKIIAIGRKTYDIMKGQGEFEKIGNPYVIVVTKNNLKDEKKVFFVKSPEEAIKTAKAKGFDKLLISGGGKTNSAFMEKGLVDYFYIDIMPILFGTGVKLFSDSDFEKKLELTRIVNLSKQVVQLQYKVL